VGRKITRLLIADDDIGQFSESPVVGAGLWCIREVYWRCRLPVAVGRVVVMLYLISKMVKL